MRVARWSDWFSGLQWRGAGVVPLVGVDIAPTGVCIVELQSSARGPRISHHAQLPLETGVWQAALDGDPQPLAQVLKRAWKASGTRQRQAAIALPAHAVITRTLCLPQPAHDEELEMLVEADAAQSLPFPRDEISLDFMTLGPSANDEGMVDVLLVAARSERIAQRVGWVEAAGLKPVVVGVESLAVVAAIARLCGDARHPECILHFSGDGTHCLFVRGERLLFERDIGTPLPALAGGGVGSGISDSSGSSGSVHREPLQAAALDDWLDAASLEWQRHAQLFAAAAGDGEIDRIHLVGAGAPGPWLASGLRQRLGIDVSVPDPFQHWPGVQRQRLAASVRDGAPATDGQGGDLDADNLHADGACCLLACGLALRGLGA